MFIFQSIILNDTFYIMGGYGGTLLNDIYSFKLPPNLTDFLSKNEKDFNYLQNEGILIF